MAFIMIVLAVVIVIGNLLMRILDALQVVIWIYWNCLPMAMFDMGKIVEDVEFNEHFYPY